MFKSVSALYLAERIQVFKSSVGPSNIVTNYFNSQLNYQGLQLIECENAIYFIGTNKEIGLNHYFFMAKSSYLSSFAFDFPRMGRLVAEYIFQPPLNIEVSEHLESLRFLEYAQLRKMSFTRGKSDFAVRPSNLIKNCDIGDLFYLKGVFDHHFDPISERNPNESELQAAIEADSIFKYVDQDNVLGFYWADAKKFLAELRYLFVGDSSRGKGVGQALVEHHLFVTKDVKKNQLWVLKNNGVAIRLYEKYGYRFEDLQDLILMRED